jgi:hypothetical protein
MSRPRPRRRGDRTRRILLHCMSPEVAHRDILRRRAVLVAFGIEADISSWAEFDDLSKMTQMRHQASFELRAILTRPNRKVVVFTELHKACFPAAHATAGVRSQTLSRCVQPHDRPIRAIWIRQSRRLQ